MMEYLLDKTADRAAPPTKEAIERLRAKQFEMLKAIRKRLLDVRQHQNPAA